MNLVSRAARSYLWSQAGRVAEATLLFCVSLILARALGPKSYGLYALGLSLIGICSFVASMGIAQETMGRFIPQTSADVRGGSAGRILRTLIVIRLAAIVVLAGAFYQLRGSLAKSFHLSLPNGYVVLVLTLFAFRSISDILTYFFASLLQLRIVVIAKFIVPFAALAILFVGLQHGFNSVVFAFGALVVGQMLGLGVLATWARGYLHPSDTTEPNPEITIRRVLAFSMFAWISNIFIYILSDGSDVLLIGWLIKDSSAMGYYSVGSSLVFRSVSLLLAWLPLLSIPTLSSAYFEKGMQGLAQAAGIMWKLIAASLIPSLILLLRFSREVVTLFYSQKYLPSVPILQILAVLLATSALFGHGLQCGILYTLDREKISCAVFAAAAMFNVVLGVILIKIFGIHGAAYATGLSFVLFAILSAGVGRAFSPVRAPVTFIFDMVLASVIASVATLWLRPNSFVYLVGASALWVGVFLFCLWLVKPLSLGDSNTLRRINLYLGLAAERFFAQAK
jgi:O-antigen/teichoic acid export membrane protein